MVCRMKTKAIYLTTTLLLVSSSLVLGDSAAGQLQLRYGDSSGNCTLSVRQNIKAGQNGIEAKRSFAMDLEFSDANDAVSFKINKARGSYTAHDMTQRLPASNLTGQRFVLSKADNGRAFERIDADVDPAIPVGQISGADYSIGLALADILPILPQGPVGVGSSWTTMQDTRSLEGWAWASGSLSSEHVITDIDQVNGHSIVSVTSKAHALLGKTESGPQYGGEGELSRTSEWQFDANDGRLLSLSMRQNTSGSNRLPQGEVGVRQLTKVEFKMKN